MQSYIDNSEKIIGTISFRKIVKSNYFSSCEIGYKISKAYWNQGIASEAIEKGLDLLKRGGLMCVSVYYGGDSGYEEKDALLPFLKSLDDEKYQVLATFFYNWKKDPPIPIFIIKN